MGKKGNKAIFDKHFGCVRFAIFVNQNKSTKAKYYTGSLFVYKGDYTAKPLFLNISDIKNLKKIMEMVELGEE